MFKTDQPIESWRDDVLGRASFAQASGEVILSYKEKDSIVRWLEKDSNITQSAF